MPGKCPDSDKRTEAVNIGCLPILADHLIDSSSDRQKGARLAAVSL